MISEQKARHLLHYVEYQKKKLYLIIMLMMDDLRKDISILH